MCVLLDVILLHGGFSILTSFRAFFFIFHFCSCSCQAELPFASLTHASHEHGNALGCSAALPVLLLLPTHSIPRSLPCSDRLQTPLPFARSSSSSHSSSLLELFLPQSAMSQLSQGQQRAGAEADAPLICGLALTLQFACARRLHPSRAFADGAAAANRRRCRTGTRGQEDRTEGRTVRRTIQVSDSGMKADRKRCCILAGADNCALCCCICCSSDSSSAMANTTSRWVPLLLCVAIVALCSSRACVCLLTFFLCLLFSASAASSSLCVGHVGDAVERIGHQRPTADQQHRATQRIHLQRDQRKEVSADSEREGRGRGRERCSGSQLLFARSAFLLPAG